MPGSNEIRAVVEHLVGAINGEHGSMHRPAVHYLSQRQTFEELVGLYRAADVMLVTPFRDGMNLIAKEYVASRVDHDGVLILSEFAGAAQQLTQAVLVNPYDLDGLKDAIELAVNQPCGPNGCDMGALAANVHRDDAHHWANAFLAALDDRTTTPPEVLAAGLPPSNPKKSPIVTTSSVSTVL